jgi:hypothetical protein
MKRLRALIWAMGIWATAISTLLAGVPFLQCHCPDGHVKPFCGSLLFPSTCCERSCCGSLASSHILRENQQSATKKTCCCCEASRHEKAGEQIRPMGCQKTFAKAPVAPRSDVVRYSAHALVSGTLMMAVSTPVPFVNAPPECGRFNASLDWPLLSSDRVIALRHLLI